ncbi:MAG: thiaminase II/PqqC family protein, partial [Mycobacteriaceae bacterium]
MASLADSLWHRNWVLAEAALEHPFVQGIASGELAPAAFAYYVGQDAAFLAAFCRAYALA